MSNNSLFFINFTLLKKNVSMEKFNINFNKLENSISFSNEKNFLTLKIFKNFQFIQKTNILKTFFFSNVQNFKTFLRAISNIIIGITSNWYASFEMLGLGYRFFFNREESTLRLKLGYSHYIMLPLNLFNLKIKSKRRLGKTYILISCISKVYLCFIASILLNYRKLNIYKLKGIYPKNYLKIKSLKQGKKKSLT